MLTRSSGRMRIPLIQSQFQQDEAWMAECAEVAPLSSSDEVILKDTWNKFVAWKHIGMEAFAERLYIEEPELLATLQSLGDEVEEIFFGLCDLAIRQLQPHTEQLGREAVCPVHVDPRVEWKTLPEYARWFADIGVKPHHWDVIRRVWLWSFRTSFILEEYETIELSRGKRSAFYRFFTRKIMAPMFDAIVSLKEALSSMKEAKRLWEEGVGLHTAPGSEWVHQLVAERPEWNHFFASSDPEAFGEALFSTIDSAVHQLDDEVSMFSSLREDSELFTAWDVRACAFSALPDVLVDFVVEDHQTVGAQALRTFLRRVCTIVSLPVRRNQKIFSKAKEWLELMAQECHWDVQQLQRRLDEIAEELRHTGTYTHTTEELSYGAQVAWRNAAKCIGRVNWNNMIVRDRRECTDPDEMYQEILEHLEMATCGGNIQIVMTVFAPKAPCERWGPRLWNTQYVRYAGYELPDGSILGDPDNVEYTKKAMEYGWEPLGEPGEFDLLPVMIDSPGHEVKLYELPEESVVEVDLAHPNIPEFASLKLKWCAVPAVANIGLDLGGIRYTCVPFNGWFMGTEIARDLFDTHRYNKAEDIARLLELDTSSEQTLWRDRAFVELNVAVLHSFKQQRITLVDHHTASRQFLIHDRREKKAGRECPARWSWVVPPMSGSVTEVFHHEMREFLLEPQYRELCNRWQILDAETQKVLSEEIAAHSDSKILILFGSESGTAENYAYQTATRLKTLSPEVKALDECKPSDLKGLDLLLVISSTFGDGELPKNARLFAQWMEQQSSELLKGLAYGVLGIGSSIYENYCAAGMYLNELLERKGASRLLPLHKADEVNNQARRANTWSERIAKVLQIDGLHTESAEKTFFVEFLDTPPTEFSVPQGAFVQTHVVHNLELMGASAEKKRSTRSIALDTSVSEITYEAGDHLGVYPINPQEAVEQICECVEVDPDAYFTMEHSHEISFPLPTTPRQVLSEELDISLHGACRGLLKAMHQAATDQHEKQALASLLETLTQQTTSGARRHLADHFRGLADLLTTFPSAKLYFSQLLRLLPRQKPRFYSISSSPLYSPETLALTVGVVQVEMNDGSTRPGLCSHYLAGLSEGEEVRVFVRTSEFRPPKDPSAPVLMVGPGTGISPLIGFLEEREAQLEALGVEDPEEAGFGPVWLFFGCRHEGEFLYRERLEQWLERGLLRRLDVAYSQVGDEKTYVQDLMRQHADEVWAMLSKPDCHAFLCGDTQMANDVLEVWRELAEDIGELNPRRAKNFLKRMEKKKQLLMDVWSNTSEKNEVKALAQPLHNPTPNPTTSQDPRQLSFPFLS